MGWINALSIRTKLVLLVILISIASPILSISLSNAASIKALKQQYVQDTRGALLFAEDTLDNYFGDIIKTADFPYSNRAFLRDLHREWADSNGYLRNVSTEEVLSQVLFTRSDLNSVSFYADRWDKLFIVSTEFKRTINGPPSEWLGDKLFTYKHGFNIEEWNSPTFTPNYYSGEGAISSKNSRFTLKRSIYDQFEYLGILYFDINGSKLMNIMNYLQNDLDEFVLLFDEQGAVIYKSGASWSDSASNNLFQTLANKSRSEFEYDMGGDTKLVLSAQLPHSPWTLVKGISNKALGQRLHSAIGISVAIQAAFTVTGLLLALLLSIWLYQPLHILVRGINRVKQGDLAFRLPTAKGREMVYITESFNQMTRQLHQLIEVEYSNKLHLQQAQLKALQAQINPHFLYNTFQVIGSIAIEQGVEEINEITSSLSKICRYSIQPDIGLVQLKEEIEHLQYYIQIQELRFEQLQTKFLISESAKKAQIPKLTLQPLVENAIIHGFRNKMHDCIIIIQASEVGEYIAVTIADNGEGIEEGRLKHLLQLLEKPGGNGFDQNSMGLVNIQERLHLHFGSGSIFNMESVLGEGTTIRFLLPIAALEGSA